MDAHSQAREIRGMLEAAARLRAAADPLIAGQVAGLIGRLTALLAAIGEPVPADALAPATAASPSRATLPAMRLDGLVALVTGGGGGLGTLAACAFAEAGADIAVVARSLDKCEAVAARVRALGRRAIVVAADVTDSAAVHAMVERVKGHFGRIDILFNNAGITSPKSMLDSTEEEWLRIIDVNVKGTFIVTKAVAPVMKAQGSGTIINMGSILSGVGMANRSAYSTSKAAVANFTRSIAHELGPLGIRVNTLGPTVIVTDLNRELVKTQPQLYGTLLARTSLGRLGQPEDLAGALVFLASPAAAFITGQTLYVDGGYMAA